MYRSILLSLNIKPNEAALVRKLFTVQFFLGIATAFYFTSTLTMFLSAYKIETLPLVYVFSALLLFGFNRVYAYFDETLNSPRLLELVMMFAAVSVFVFWLLLSFLPFPLLIIIIAAWYLVIYMLVGYAFWGMASIMFNVRESKRLFSIVGAGDIPAKMIGYFAVSVLIHYVSANNLLWISIASFIIAWLLMKRYQNQGFIVASDPNEPHEHHAEVHTASKTRSMLKRFFYNKLILCIALLSIVSYVVFGFIDYTFLADIKVRFKKSEQIATFIGIFFAAGRFLAIMIKLFFSSRMIARMGLSNALLVTPLLLVVCNVIILVAGSNIESHLFIFGLMVLLAEVLRSTLQEPVFFILFQPLKPHDRLRGHLVAKGYTMPVALLGVGTFLYLFMRNREDIPIALVSGILIFFLGVWIASIYLIRKQYMQTLVDSLRKGYFAGAELFLNDKSVINILLAKTRGSNPINVIHALNLLERSGFADMENLLLERLHHPSTQVSEYVLTRVIQKKMTSALPHIKEMISEAPDRDTNPQLIKAFYFLEDDENIMELVNIEGLTQHEKKPAIIGLLHRQNNEIEQKIKHELEKLATQGVTDKLLVLDIITETGSHNFSDIVKTLLADEDAAVYKSAIEAVGHIKEFALFSEMAEVTEQRKAYPAFKRSLNYFGDEIFSDKYWQAENMPFSFLPHVVKTAGVTKGDNSTKFLLKLLKTHQAETGRVIDALWLKKATLSAEDAALVNEWVQTRIEQSKEKINYYNDLQKFTQLQQVQEAIGSELKQDLQMLLKAFALLFDRQKVDRVIELLGVEHTERIYNAIEVLELILPKKYFTQLNVLVELMNDIRHKQVLLPRAHDTNSLQLVEEILSNQKADFTEWTRSVACFVLPKLKKDEAALGILRREVKKDEVLFVETRNYVLSLLNW